MQTWARVPTMGGGTMQEVKFWCYFVLARVRGIGRAYNAMPKGEAVSTGIHKLAEVRTMFFRHGWIPYCLTGRGGSFLCS